MWKPWLLALAGVATTGAGALGSSDDAWQAFREDVAAACLKAAEPAFDGAAVIVDPFGSASYGLALVHGTAKGSAGTAKGAAAGTEIRSICVYDKKTKVAEIGGELPADTSE